MQLRQLIQQLRGLVNLGGGTQLEDLSGGSTPRVAGQNDPLQSGSSVHDPQVNGVKTTKHSGSEVRGAVQQQIGAKNMKLLPLDSHYWVPEEQSYHRLVNLYRDEIGENIYQGDSYDCDNYSINFLNFFQNEYGVNSVGFVFDGDSQHSYNVVVYESTDGLNVRLFEPNFFSMDGGEVDPTDTDGYYSVHTSTVLL